MALRTLLYYLLIIICIGCNKTSEDEQIEKVFSALEQLWSFEAQEKIADSLAIIQKTLTYFEADFSIEADESIYDVPSKDALKERLTIVRRQLEQLEVKFSLEDLEVEANSAEVEVMLSALGSFSREDKFFDQHLFKATLLKTESNWKIASVTHLENLRGEGSFSGQTGPTLAGKEH